MLNLLLAALKYTKVGSELFVLAVREAAEVAETAHSIQFEVPADLSFVVAVHSAYVLESWEALGHWIVKLS